MGHSPAERPRAGRGLNEAAFRGSSLCVVGNINRDIKLAPLSPSKALFRDGETPVSRIEETIGGGGANSAFAAAGLGAKVTFLGKVGADDLGQRLVRTLKQHRIVPGVTRDPGQPSGSSIALSFTNGQRHFVSCLPANRALALADLDLDILRGQRHLLRADVWFSEAMLFGGNRVLFARAKKMGLAISLDLNWDPCWSGATPGPIRTRKQAVRAILPYVNLAHGNARELIEFADATTLEQALARITRWGADAVVVHLGASGAGYYQPGSWVVEPPTPLRRRCQTAGTGDVLSVCMMLLHARPEIPIADRLRLANSIVAQFIEGRRELIPPLSD